MQFFWGENAHFEVIVAETKEPFVDVFTHHIQNFIFQEIRHIFKIIIINDELNNKYLSFNNYFLRVI